MKRKSGAPAPFSKGNVLEAEMSGIFAPYTDQIFPVQVTHVYRTAQECRCRLMPFDKNDTGSYDKWGFDQLHEPRGVSMAGNWHIGDCVHVWIETPKGFDESLKVWQKGIVTGLAENGHRCFVKLRVYNEQREELEEEIREIGIDRLRPDWGAAAKEEEEEEEDGQEHENLFPESRSPPLKKVQQGDPEDLCMHCSRPKSEQDGEVFLCDGENCTVAFHASCAGYSSALVEDPIYRGHDIVLQAYCDHCMDPCNTSSHAVLDQQAEYQQLVDFFAVHKSSWVWMPVAQDGRCSLACVWEWLQMVIPLQGSVEVGNSLDEFIKLTCRGALQVLDARPDGHDTRTNAVNVRRNILQVEKNPERLAELWPKLDTQYIWMGLVTHVSPTVQIRLWEYQKDTSLRCTVQFPDEREQRHVLDVLHWNNRVSSHFDLLLGLDSPTELSLGEGATEQDVEAILELSSMTRLQVQSSSSNYPNYASCVVYSRKH
jgi:hypothetical protein